MRSLFLAVSLFVSAGLVGDVLAQEATAPARSAAASAPTRHETVLLVEAFMQTLATGDLDKARAYMTPDAVVIANGQVLGNRDAYLAGAAKEDAAALRGVQRELLNRAAKAGADLGWVVSEKRYRDPRNARQLHLTETMLLAKTDAGWKITGIHWSGRNEK